MTKPDQEQPTRKPSPFDTFAQKLFDLIGDQLHAELTSPSFGAALRSAGIAVTPACQSVPEPSEEWVESAMELFGRFGELTEPLDHVAEMWQTAYEAGWQGYAAQRGDLAADLERSTALVAELRRQLGVQLLQVGRLRWLARYLPAAIRGLALGASRPFGERPPTELVDWADAVDQRAAGAGLTPYPGEQT